MTFKTLFAASTAAIALATATFAANPTVGGAPMLEERNIIENAVNSPIHTTLVAAVQAAELVETLQGEGPFTVFAPVDDAFAKLPADTVKTLGTPEGAKTLESVLTYHVIPGQIAPDEIDGTHKTVNGADLEVTGSGDDIKVNGNSAVICGGVKTANATVYLIDSVLMPPAS